MNPRSFSASSLLVAGQCLSRYYAENITYGREFQGSAAGVGVVCHGTLEDFLRVVCIKKETAWEDRESFDRFFEQNFQKVFGSDRTVPEYEDSRTLCENWYNREDQEIYFRGVKVVSLESKLSYSLPVLVNGKKETRPFNYIMDRVDRVGPGHYRVVDYKSNRVALRENELHKNKQARYYALMIQIRFKDAEIIEVEFDYLRHRPVRTTFTRDDSVQTWGELRRATQRIIDAPEERIPETLNSNCGWCVRKSSCKTLQNNIAAGGIMSKDVDDLARLHLTLSQLGKAQSELLAQVEMMLLTHAIEIDELDFETDSANVTVLAPTRRKVNNDWVAAVLGADVGKFATFSASTVDKLLRKSSHLTEKQRALLKQGAFEVVMGEPTVRVAMKDAPE